MQDSPPRAEGLERFISVKGETSSGTVGAAVMQVVLTRISRASVK